MHFNSFKKILLKINDFNLPGHDSLSNMAPPSRINLLKNRKIPSDCKKAAVLMLFYPDNNNNTRMVLILRNKYEGVHSNQISFPGGKMDKEDKNLELTALRETHEEIGIKSSSIVFHNSRLYTTLLRLIFFFIIGLLIIVIIYTL